MDSNSPSNRFSRVTSPATVYHWDYRMSITERTAEQLRCNSYEGVGKSARAHTLEKPWTHRSDSEQASRMSQLGWRARLRKYGQRRNSQTDIVIRSSSDWNTCTLHQNLHSVLNSLRRLALPQFSPQRCCRHIIFDFSQRWVGESRTRRKELAVFGRRVCPGRCRWTRLLSVDGTTGIGQATWVWKHLYVKDLVGRIR